MKNKNIQIHETSIIDDNVIIGINTNIWHFSHISENAIIGNNCIIGQNVYIGPSVKIGNNCKIQNNVSIYKGVTLEDNVFCGPSCVFTNVVNPRSKIERKNEFMFTFVRTGATIGANATIICGNEIGEYAFIGASALITKNVYPYAIMIGAPAKKHGWMSQAGARLDQKLICPIDGTKYIKRGDKIELESSSKLDLNE